MPQAPLGRQGSPTAGAGDRSSPPVDLGSCQLLAQRQVRRKQATAHAGKMQVRPESWNSQGGRRLSRDACSC